MQQRFTNFFHRAAIVQRAAHVTFQFLRALQRCQGGEGDQAAGFKRQAFAAPDAAPGVFVDEILQRLGELGGVAQRAVDEGVAHHLAAYFNAGLLVLGHGNSLLWCWRCQARSDVNSKNATSAGRTKNSIRCSSLPANGMPVVNDTTCRP